MDQIVIPAPAKINLALDIKGIRSDGFHQVEMIMQSISLHDLITIRKNNGGVRLNVSDTRLPTDKGNIAFQAAELILQRSALTAGVDIDIEKNIPLAAGLAGGSTDAAAVLIGIKKLYDLSFNESIMVEMAASLGSDVPFCLHGGTAFAYGRGAEIKQLADLNRKDLVIVNSGLEISTAWAYHEFDNFKSKDHIDIHKFVSLIESSSRIDWTEGWENVFEEVVISSYKEIEIIKSLLRNMGAKFVLMSGSGSTVFAIVENQQAGKFIRNNWPRENDFITTAWTVKKDFLELWRR